MAHEENLQERIRELEDVFNGWNLTGSNSQDNELSTPTLKEIARIARIFFLKNPLINRAVTVKADYIWGRGIQIAANDPILQEVITAFMTDPVNKRAFFGLQARLDKERELQLDGNLFFVLFSHPATGKVRLATFPFAELEEIITNPDNVKEPWFYKRTYTYNDLDISSGIATPVTKTVYYRDWRYRGDPILAIGGYPVSQDGVVYHLAVGGFSDWVCGVSELYSPLDWSKGYTDFLSNYASLVRALSRYAWNLTVQGGARGVAAAKTKLNTTLGTDGTERNPPPLTGSTLVSTGGDKMEPIRTSGSVTPASEGRPLKLMVAAGTGIPETFFGDADVGNHATAKTLDRPTELGFTNRQLLWIEVYQNLFDYVKERAVSAPDGLLNGYGEVVQNEYGERVVTFDEGFNSEVVVSFPALLERDLDAFIKALITAFTLDGKQIHPMFSNQKYVARMILTALGETDLDKVLEELFPEGSEVEVSSTTFEEALKALRDLANAPS